MSVVTINTYSRLSDSMERDLLQAASTNNQAYSAIDGLAIVVNAISRGTASFARYLVQVAEALNEARALDSRFSGSHW